MESPYTAIERYSRRISSSVLPPLAIVLALITGLVPLGPGGRAEAQKEGGVIISNNEVTLKPGYAFRRVSSSKLEVVRESTDPELAAKRAAAVVVGGVYCSCVDPKTDLNIFCDTVIVGGKASCSASTRCKCTPKAE